MANFFPGLHSEPSIQHELKRLRHENAHLKMALSDARAGELKARTFQMIADEMPQMVWSTLPNGFHDYCNKQWYEFTGAPIGSTDGEGWNEMFHPEDQEKAWSRFKHSLATGELYEVEYRLRHHSGKYRWTLGRALPIRNSLGEITRWVGTCTDIEELRETADALERALQARDNFLSLASHELKTPLTSLRLQAQLNQRVFDRGGIQAFTAERIQKMIQNPIRHSEKLERLVDDMLDVSQIAAGSFSVEKERTDFSALILDVVEQFRFRIDSQNGSVVLKMKDHVYIDADPYRIEQFLTNLLMNAIQYAPGKRIEIGLSQVKSLAIFTLRDFGAGIPTDKVDRVFDRFERFVSSSEVSGLGLGLYVSREIIRAHGGSIEVHNASERGAMFVIKLPCVDPSTES